MWLYTEFKTLKHFNVWGAGCIGVSSGDHTFLKTVTHEGLNENWGEKSEVDVLSQVGVHWKRTSWFTRLQAAFNLTYRLFFKQRPKEINSVGSRITLHLFRSYSLYRFSSSSVRLSDWGLDNLTIILVHLGDGHWGPRAYSILANISELASGLLFTSFPRWKQLPE